MNSKNKPSLWIDSTRSHYFLIPNDQELSRGDFIILTLNGDEKKVDYNVLNPFEIPKSEAKLYLQAEMIQALDEAKKAFSNFLELELQTSQEVSLNPIPSSTQTHQTKSLFPHFLIPHNKNSQTILKLPKLPWPIFITSCKNCWMIQALKNPTELKQPVRV